jgi:hypothetical protein
MWSNNRPSCQAAYQAHLSEDFEHRARIRLPLDPSKIVLRLDDYLRLMDYFERESDWGKYRAQLHQETIA